MTTQLGNTSDSSSNADSLKQKIDLDSIIHTFVMTIISGRVQSLPRIASLVAHLTPTTETPKKKKCLEDIVCVPNLFDPHVVHSVFRCFIIKQFTFKNILQALDTSNFSQIVHPKFIPSLSSSAVFPFLLALVYVRMLKSPPKQMLAITTTLVKFQKRNTNCSYFDGHPTLTRFIQAICERQLRFIESDSLFTLRLNELFEQGYLDFLRLQQTAETLMEGEVSEEHFKTRSEIERENQQQAIGFSKVRHYATSSERIVAANLEFLLTRFTKLCESNFSPENIQTIFDLVHSHHQKKIKNELIVINCIKLMIRWCFMPAPRQQEQHDFKKQSLLEFTQISKSLMDKAVLGSQVFALSIFFLGSSLNFLDEPVRNQTFAIITESLQQRPEMFLWTENLTQVLSGIGLALVAADDDNLVELSSLLLDLWNHGTKQNEGSLPSSTHGMQLFQMFSRVYHTRMPRIRYAEEWLEPLASVFCQRFFNAQNPASKIMALYATGGLLKGIAEDGLENDSRSLLNKVITNAVLNRHIFEPHLEEFIHIVLAMIFVNIDAPFPQLEPQQILDIVSRVFQRNIFDLTEKMQHYRTATTKPQHEGVIEDLKNFKTSVLYSSLDLFVKTIGTLWTEAKSADQHKFLIDMFNVIQSNYNGWRMHSLEAEKRGFLPSDEVFEKEVRACCNDLYLIVILLINYILDAIKPSHVLVIFGIFSHLEWCAIKIQEQDVSVLSKAFDHLLSLVAPHQPDYINHLFDDIEYLQSDAFKALMESNPLTGTCEHTKDELLLSRIGFFLGLIANILDKRPADCSIELLETHILPTCFVFIEHKNNLVNTKAHNVFQAVISSERFPIRETIIPYYLSRTLDNYPKLTQVDSIAKSMALITKSLPPSSMLVPHCLQSLIDKIGKKEEKGTPYLTIILFDLITLVHSHLLFHLLDLIEDMITKASTRVQLVLCHLLFTIISTNYDYTRKEDCIKWYLALCDKLGINKLARL